MLGSRWPKGVGENKPSAGSAAPERRRILSSLPIAPERNQRRGSRPAVPERGTPMKLAHLKDFAGRLLQDEEGATMVEYALMVALIAAICVAAVTLLGGKANSTFNTTAGKMP